MIVSKEPALPPLDADDLILSATALLRAIKAEPVPSAIRELALQLQDALERRSQLKAD